MISEFEARACRPSLKPPVHPYTWGRILGPLMVWAAFMVLMIGGGLTTRLTSTPPMDQAARGDASVRHASHVPDGE
jgi:hypothetical protein